MRRRGTGLVLEAIEPSRQSVDAAELRYPHLRAALKAYTPLSYAKRGGRLLRHPFKKFPKPRRVKEELTTAYLLTASYRLQKSFTPVDKLFWSQQFTLASVGLFGRPDPAQVRRLAAAELKAFESIAAELDNNYEFANILLDAYRRLAGRTSPGRTLEQRFGDVLGEVRLYFEQEYQPVLEVFDDISDGAELAPNEVRRYFRRGLKRLAEQNARWRDWRVVSSQTAGLSVEAADKQIVVGRYRAPIKSSEIRGLFAHEVLVHAGRAVEGGKLSKRLAEGLDGYLTAEEGLGVLVEAAINRAVPYKIKDRYLDIALAMGNYHRRSVKREQLFNIYYVRAVLRSLADGQDLQLDDLENETWQHVNRIYRGSLGDRYVAVFTKDIAYFEGFNKMARYFKDHLKRGNFTSAMDYAMSGKFDPTHDLHRRAVKSLTDKR